MWFWKIYVIFRISDQKNTEKRSHSSNVYFNFSVTQCNHQLIGKTIIYVMLESEEWCHNFHPMRTALKVSNSMSCNDVKSILGRIHKNPNAGKKINEKKRQRPWTWFFKMSWKFSEETFGTTFETLRAQFLILLCEISYGSTVHEITASHRSLSGTILCVIDRVRFLPVTMTGRFSNFNSISYTEDRHGLRVTDTKCRLADIVSGTG